MSSILIWITKTTRAGDTNARIGIAEQLSNTWREVPIPTEFCSVSETKERLIYEGLITKEQTRWPDVVIGPCFHIPYMQLIKTLSGGKSLIVALRPPVRGLPIKAASEDVAKTDIIVSYPYHNNDWFPNVLLCNTVPHRVTSEKLAEGKRDWNALFSKMHGGGEGALIGVLVGGNIGERRRVFDSALSAELGRIVSHIARTMNARVVVSLSSRTGKAAGDSFKSSVKAPCYIYDPLVDDGKNPYFGILSCSDYIIATADSISMCCEAVGTGKPVYIFSRNEIVEKAHGRIVSHLITEGKARLLPDKGTLPHFSYPSTNSAIDVAGKIQERLAGYRQVNSV